MTAVKLNRCAHRAGRDVADRDIESGSVTATFRCTRTSMVAL